MINLDVILDPGAIVGTSLSSAHLNLLNQKLGGSIYFDNIGESLSNGYKSFVNNFVKPYTTALTSVKNMFAGTINVSGIITIDNTDVLSRIPMEMHMPILQYQPVRQLFDQGRVFGFGYDEIPPDDPYGRVISNGCISDIQDNMDKDGYNTTAWVYEQGDPVLSIDEIDALRDTREYIDYILEHKDWDPTDYPNTRM